MSAFTQYLDLENAVVDWLDREDVRDKMGEFVRLVTVRAARDLRVPIMERALQLPVYANGDVKVPVDLMEIKQVSWTCVETRTIINELGEEETGNYVLDRKALNRTTDFERINNKQTGNEVNPTHFTREGAMLKVCPLPKSAELITPFGLLNTDVVGYVEIQYFALPMTMKSDIDSNWLLEIAPDVYLYGCLMHGSRYFRDDESALYWEAQFEKSIAQVQNWSDRDMYSGGPMIVGSGGYN